MKTAIVMIVLFNGILPGLKHLNMVLGAVVLSVFIMLNPQNLKFMINESLLSAQQKIIFYVISPRKVRSMLYAVNRLAHYTICLLCDLKDYYCSFGDDEPEPKWFFDFLFTPAFYLEDLTYSKMQKSKGY